MGVVGSSNPNPIFTRTCQFCDEVVSTRDTYPVNVDEVLKELHLRMEAHYEYHVHEMMAAAYAGT